MTDRVCADAALMLPARELRNLAHGLAGTFISRNNDVSGYWGIGMLYSECLAAACTTVEFDLIARCCLPDGPVARIVVSRHADWLAARLKRRHIASARVTLQFGTSGNCVVPTPASHGDPFLCEVSLTAMAGRTYRAARAGRCIPHSAAERRSARVDADHPADVDP